jgi:tRNA A-37 threonylcarbamoyl transferase component Bud32
MQLELTADEIAVLADVVDSAVREIREEVYKSEVASYKDELKRREAVLTTVLQRLGAGRATAG